MEVVVAAGLAVVVFVAALDLSWRGLGLVEKARRGFEEAAELRNAAAWVTRDLRRAESIDWAASGSLSMQVWDSGGGWGMGTVVYELRDGVLVRDDMGWVKEVARGLERADFCVEERDGGVLVTAEFAGKNGGRARTCVWVYTGS
ncbi:MAG: hypothetical protein ACPLRW_08775 [Moorellales bacterium]